MHEDRVPSGKFAQQCHSLGFNRHIYFLKRPRKEFRRLFSADTVYLDKVENPIKRWLVGDKLPPSFGKPGQYQQQWNWSIGSRCFIYKTFQPVGKLW
jgi:hypothetical protein